jgi:hypothetical protein
LTLSNGQILQAENTFDTLILAEGTLALDGVTLGQAGLGAGAGRALEAAGAGRVQIQSANVTGEIARVGQDSQIEIFAGTFSADPFDFLAAGRQSTLIDTAGAPLSCVVRVEGAFVAGGRYVVSAQAAQFSASAPGYASHVGTLPVPPAGVGTSSATLSVSLVAQSGTQQVTKSTTTNADGSVVCVATHSFANGGQLVCTTAVDACGARTARAEADGVVPGQSSVWTLDAAGAETLEVTADTGARVVRALDAAGAVTSLEVTVPTCAQAAAREAQAQAQVESDVAQDAEGVTSTFGIAVTVGNTTVRAGAADAQAAGGADAASPTSALSAQAAGAVEVPFTFDATASAGAAVPITVTVEGGAAACVELPLSAEADLACVVPVLVAKDGSEQVICGAVLDGQNLRFELPAGTSTIKLVENAVAFDDVAGLDQAQAAAVEFVAARGLMGEAAGAGSAKFEPDQAVCRAQMAQVMMRLAAGCVDGGAACAEGVTSEGGTQAAGAAASAAAGAGAQTGSTFADASGQWFDVAATWAAARGLMQGYANGQFGGYDAVTREQAAVILWRYAGMPAANSDVIAGFADAASVDAFAKTAVAWAADLGILDTSGNKLAPTATLTRAQLATLLTNFLNSTTPRQ